MPKIASNRQSLLTFIVLVLLAHGMVLHWIPLALHGEWLEPTADMPPPLHATFSTRTIEPEAPSISVSQPSGVSEKPATPPIPTPPTTAPPPPAPESPFEDKAEVSKSEPYPAETTEPIAIESHTPTTLAESASDAMKKENTLAAAWQYRPPPPVTLDYEVHSVVDGTERTGAGELFWSHDGTTYNARLSVSYFRITLRTQTSTGKIGAKGLEPRRFGDKTRSEVAAHFEREKGKISFSANTPDIPLQDGAQDQLSVILQLGALLGGNPERINEGTNLPFQAVGARSAENWTFIVGKMERLKLPGGEIMARHLWREANAQYDINVDVWLAPDFGYLPVRIRLTQTNGNIIDQRWRSSEKP